MDELRKSYHHDLEAARNDLALLAARVVEVIPRATSVLLDGDLEVADLLIRGDAEIDAHSVEVEERCIQILALQAPVASDLRQVLALLKMIAEIERSGDLAVNICKAARRIYGHELDPKFRGIIGRMGEQAAAQFSAAIDALQANDASKAAASTTWTATSTRCRSSSSQPSSRARPPGESTSRSRCNWRWSPASTSASATMR